MKKLLLFSLFITGLWSQFIYDWTTNPVTITFPGDLTISGDNLFMTTNTNRFVLMGDGVNYSPEAIDLGTDTDGNYVASITDADNGIDGGDGGSESAGLTLSFDATELDAITWSDNANATNVWSFNVSGIDHTMTAGSGVMTFSHIVDATSFDIGANSLTTTEWAVLDGINQTVATGSSVIFAQVTSDGMIKAATSVYITERASALGDTPGDGQFWVKDGAPNIPMFTDDDGTDFEISLVGKGHGSMYWNRNGATITPSVTNWPMACVNLTTGALLTGFTFGNGTTGSIASVTNNGGVLRCSDVGHGLDTGDTIVLHGIGLNVHNGVTNITKINNDTFDCDEIAFSSGSDGGSWAEPDYLEVSSGGAGKYHLTWNVTCIKGAGATASIKWEPYKNAIVLDEAISQRKFPNTDEGTVVGQTLLSVVNGDRLFLIVINATNTNTILNQYGNFVMTRL